MGALSSLSPLNAILPRPIDERVRRELRPPPPGVRVITGDMDRSDDDGARARPSGSPVPLPHPLIPASAACLQPVAGCSHGVAKRSP